MRKLCPIPEYSLFFLCTLALAACSGGSGNGGDGGTPRLPLDEVLGAGQVRAGVIEAESELFSGPEAHGWLGDYKMYNQRVGFIVQNPFEPRGFGPFGGTVVDATWFDDKGLPATEVFEELLPNLDLLTLKPETAELVADGSDGQAALLRISGTHHGIPLFDGALGGTLQPLDLEITQEYILEPDVDYLLVRTALRMHSGAERIMTVGDLVMNGDLTADFVHGKGDTGGGVPAGDAPFFGGYTQESCNLYTGASGSIKPMLTIEGITPISAAKELVPKVSSGDPAVVVERILIVGSGGMDDCQRKLRRLRGQEAQAGTVEGILSDGSSGPQQGVPIYARDLALDEDLNIVGQTFSREDGSFELELPAGQYRLEARPRGRAVALSADLTLSAGQTSQAELEVEQASLLAWSCTEVDSSGSDMGQLPCKISLQAGHDAAMNAGVQTSYLTFGVSGQGQAIMPAGDFTVTLSRGWEYTIARHNVSLAPGQLVEVEAGLLRQVDTAGYISADLHNHSTRSADSEYEIMDKLSSNVVEGLELMVATDHDCQSDFAPYLASLGEQVNSDLSQWLRTVVGNEVSPIYGHMTVFPLPTHPTGWIYWQIPYVKYEDGLFSRMLEFPEMWERARELGAEVINVAHPLQSSGWYATLGFDPPDDMPALDELDQNRFGTGYDTMELLNARDVNDMIDKVVPLWSHLNNQGLFRTAVGVSDSHGRSSEAGFGRTMIQVSNDQPQLVDLDEVWQSLRQGKASVSGGIFITIEIAGAGMGEMVQASGLVQVRVRVQAADWVPVTQMDLYANGQVVVNRTLSGPGELDPTQPALRLDEEIEVQLDSDTWLAALAYGALDDKLTPVFRNARPVGLTNAIRVDVDGNGQFNPPGI